VAAWSTTTTTAWSSASAPTEKASEAIFSIVVFPRYFSLAFLQGTKVPDPRKLLQGNGNVARHIRLDPPETLDRPEVQEVIDAAMESAVRPIDPKKPGSAGAAAELAETDRFTFAEECRKHGVPLVNYPAEDLQAELAALQTKS
jgi:hypothetical protein